MIAKEMLRLHLASEIDRLHIQLECEHVWKSEGHGLSCTKCNYYTGNGTPLNHVIRQESSSIFPILGEILKPADNQFS